jgi:hypothetical protein
MLFALCQLRRTPGNMHTTPDGMAITCLKSHATAAGITEGTPGICAQHCAKKNHTGDQRLLRQDRLREWHYRRQKADDMSTHHLVPPDGGRFLWVPELLTGPSRSALQAPKMIAASSPLRLRPMPAPCTGAAAAGTIRSLQVASTAQMSAHDTLRYVLAGMYGMLVGLSHAPCCQCASLSI